MEQPQVTFTSFRINTEVLKLLHGIAKEEGRSATKQLEIIIRYYTKKYSHKEAK